MTRPMMFCAPILRWGGASWIPRPGIPRGSRGSYTATPTMAGLKNQSASHPWRSLTGMPFPWEVEASQPGPLTGPAQILSELV